MKRLLTEPLLQFFVLGLLLFLLISVFSPSQMQGDSAKDIVVDEAVLKEYVQFQRKSFDAQTAANLLVSMSPHERQNLIDNYVRDEALFREAVALGLDANDEIIRRRLIQKMEYIAQGFYNDIPILSEDHLRAYFEANKDLYRIASSATFTHVFISLRKPSGQNSQDKAKEAAENLLQDLLQDQITFDQAGKYGNRFLYNLNYVERTPSYVASHFGAAFEEALFALAASKQWQGPVQSKYGWHLVMLKDKSRARDPKLEEVAQIVLADAQRDQQRQMKATAIDQLVDKYNAQVSMPSPVIVEH
ncbi:MAG: peptidyl-prolyl cis-trans isomerase C [Gammaproteobacteria bacterium]|jgi:peptidyl-prolyl cis-trans isomerase C